MQTEIRPTIDNDTHSEPRTEETIQAKEIAKPEASAQAELSLVKAQLRQSQRLASLGTTSAMVAHEINNLLTPILGYARFALDEDDKTLMVKALNMTLTQAEAITTLAERVLGMAIDKPTEYTSVSVREIIDGAMQCLFRDLRKDGINLVTQISDRLMVRADANQIQQVFFNLLLNARDALHGRTGRITIKADQHGENIRIAFSDDGCGIPEDVLPNIFETFFTTKSNTQDTQAKRQSGRVGSGLGLAVCKDIINEHGGSIEVRSKPNDGTTFVISLPSC